MPGAEAEDFGGRVSDFRLAERRRRRFSTVKNRIFSAKRRLRRSAKQGIIKYLFNKFEKLPKNCLKKFLELFEMFLAFSLQNV